MDYYPIAVAAKGTSAVPTDSGIRTAVSHGLTVRFVGFSGAVSVVSASNKSIEIICKSIEILYQPIETVYNTIGILIVYSV